MVTLGGIPRHPATLLAALCIASWITMGEMGDDVIDEACTARTGNVHCFRLYNPGEATSWLSAYDFCLTQGLRLATVQDSQAQEALVTLSRPSQHDTSTKHAWIAGRRSTDDTWRTTDLSLSYDVLDKTRRYCSQLVRGEPVITFDLTAAPCVYNEFTTASSLCQYQQTSESCESGWFHLDDQCFQVVSEESGSWYDGRADCRDAGPPGVESHLAYSHLTDPRLFQELLPKNPRTLWSGVYRNPWVWLTANLTELEISDFFWVPGQGASPSLNDCLYADLKEGSSWGARLCSDNLDYVICEQASWITMGEMGDTVDDAIAEACTANTGNGHRCFRLYTPVEATSWLAADDFCRTRGLRLATVQDSQAQEALVNLSWPSQHGTKHAWIAGRHSTDATWRATDPSLSYDVLDDTGRYCSQLVRGDPVITFDLTAAPCVDNDFTPASSLCQYQQTSESCESGWFHLDDQCFQVVSEERGSWYDGRADCRDAGPPGVERHLAYSHLTDPRLFQELPPETPHTLWVGVYRNPWVWLTANLTELEISDFFWVLGQVASPSLSYCLYADLIEGSSWGPRLCSDSLDYVICEQVKPIETTSIVTDGNVTATKAVESNGVLQENPILIGCLAGGIGVLSVVVIILIIMLRKRKKESNPKPPPIHTGLDGSPYAVTTIVTSPETAGNNYQGLPNSDDASWTWENHVTPSQSSGPLEPGVPGSASPRPGEGDYDEPWDDIMTRLGLQPPEPDLISQAGARGPPGSIPMATLRAERWAGGELEPRPPAMPLKHPDLAANPYRRSIQPAS